MRGRVGLLLLGVLLVALPVTGVAKLATEQIDQGGGPVYSVNLVLTGLAQHPRQWAGRIVRVRAVVAGSDCPHDCNSLSGGVWEDIRDGRRLTLLESRERNPMDLLLSVAPRSSLLDALSSLPILGPHIPGQRIDWQSEAIYRLRLQTRACPAPAPSCYVGILLNAIPSDPGVGWP